MGMSTVEAYDYIFYPPVNTDYNETVLNDSFLYEKVRSPYGKTIVYGSLGATVTLEGFKTGTGEISNIGATLRAYSVVHGK